MPSVIAVTSQVCCGGDGGCAAVETAGTMPGCGALFPGIAAVGASASCLSAPEMHVRVTLAQGLGNALRWGVGMLVPRQCAACSVASGSGMSCVKCV